jgi:hypothetical protein
MIVSQMRPLACVMLVLTRSTASDRRMVMGTLDDLKSAIEDWGSLSGQEEVIEK